MDLESHIFEYFLFLSFKTFLDFLFVLAKMGLPDRWDLDVFFVINQAKSKKISCANTCARSHAQAVVGRIRRTFERRKMYLHVLYLAETVRTWESGTQRGTTVSMATRCPKSGLRVRPITVCVSHCNKLYFVLLSLSLSDSKRRNMYVCRWGETTDKLQCV